MIVHIVTRPHFYTSTAYFKTWGKDLAARRKLLFYEHLTRSRSLPVGTYIFSDIERLRPDEAEMAAQVWQCLANSGHHLRLLNHPTLSMRRYELLRTLYEQGLNAFNIYRLTELRNPQLFPVFIRGENDHNGAVTPLLHTPAELQAAIQTLERQGCSREDKVIVEYCDTADEHGVFRKYSAFVVGDQIVPTHVFFSHHWLTKVAVTEQRISEAMLREEQQFVETNPHADALKAIARIARIEYGRIDYGVLDGRVQVWEINTNPMLPRLNYGEEMRKGILQYSTSRLNAAFEAVNCQRDATGHITNPVYESKVSRAVTFAHAAVPISMRVFARHTLTRFQQLRARRFSPGHQ